ncbi:hypothetical protein DTL42_15165 [Bremerella cremea]|uniref:Carrier domain-containing protein n=1 Tax=Bremerella cremea TaxID=1031537 RepID=A0A368KR96_9BACT|nr:SUMF1/EgtB/PvdO family nonheme iron enzyme [Bremerella cremea]RCS46309.1 hypothetical protein DTL42_15165 [Bremerella cremea]
MPDSPYYDLNEIEPRVCQLAAEVLGLKLDEVLPESRLIEDLHVDSLCMVELFMTVEEEFDIEIPNKPTNPFAKSVFTRNPFRIRDLAEVVYLQQESCCPQRSGWRRQVVARSSGPELTFTQLSGRFQTSYPVPDPLLYERLEAETDVPLFRRFSDGMRCFQLPGGQVTLGSQAPIAQADEGPVHSVELDSFLIDAEPVSTTAHCRFLNSIHSFEKQWRDWFLLEETDDRIAQMQIELTGNLWRPLAGTEWMPMVLVSWWGANAYSLWTNRWDWHFYQSHAGFLPTEAQWEYAAQGAYQEVANDETEALSYVAAQHEPGTTYVADSMRMAPVHALLGVSKFGLHHMAGNVWQWCRDWYAEDFYQTPAAQDRNPVNTQPTGIRSERGGSWVGPTELCRPSYRRGREPWARGRCLGFRCVGQATNLP